jgi:HD-GYP domain-containing protein (c-di-GMP phosphodiesterase class II)
MISLTSYMPGQRQQLGGFQKEEVKDESTNNVIYSNNIALELAEERLIITRASLPALSFLGQGIEILGSKSIYDIFLPSGLMPHLRDHNPLLKVIAQMIQDSENNMISNRDLYEGIRTIKGEPIEFASMYFMINACPSIVNKQVRVLLEATDITALMRSRIFEIKEIPGEPHQPTLHPAAVYVMRRGGMVEPLLKPPGPAAENYIGQDGLLHTTWVSESLVIDLGYSLEVIQRKGIYGFTHPEDVGLLDNYKAEIRSGNTINSFVLRLLPNNSDTYLFYRVHTSALNVGDGIVSVTNSFENITLEIEAVSRQEILLQRTEALVNASPVGMIFVSEDGDIKVINPALKTLIKSLGEFEDFVLPIKIGEFINRILDPRSEETLQELIHDACEGRNGETRVEIIDEKGKRRYLQFKVISIASQTKSGEFDVVIDISDTTGSVELQELLQLQADAARILAEYHEVKAQEGEIMLQMMMDVFVPVIERFDDALHKGHTRRVPEEAVKFYKFLKTITYSEYYLRFKDFVDDSFQISDEELEHFRIGGTLHDVGKVLLDLKMLMKPELTPEERLKMEDHVLVLERTALNRVKHLPIVKKILNVIKYHHARWDGNTEEGKIDKFRGKLGRTYPVEFNQKGKTDVKKGFSIPLWGRIFSLIDTYDAARAERGYKDGKSKFLVLYEMLRDAGYQFDPILTVLFVEHKLKNDDSSDFPRERELEKSDFNGKAITREMIDEEIQRVLRSLPKLLARGANSKKK